MSTLPTLGYWDMRGLGEPIRYLLKYIDIQFNDKRHKHGEGTTLQDLKTIDKNWIPLKFTLGLDFPDLPYYIDGDLKLSKSLVIMRYLGRKYGLFANDEKSLARQDLVEQQIFDLRFEFIWGLLWNKDEYEKKKEPFLKDTLPLQLELLSKFLGDNQWLAGKLTYVDFLAYETLDWFKLYSPESVLKFDNLTEYLKRFESLPAINAYMNSSEFIRWPLLGKFVSWGS